MRTLLLFIIGISLSPLFAQHSFDSPVVLGYFPSWSETYTTDDQPSKLRDVPSHVNYVFLAFAKPDLAYTKGSYDISQTGIEVPYGGCALKESVSALREKGTHVILSVGGETYWNSSTIYDNIDYQAIKDLVDDIGFVGIDWDFEPNGSFANIGTPENVQHFIDFFNNSRALMPKSEGYLLACAPSGLGALGGQNNDDPTSPFRYSERNTLTGENDNNLYNFSAQTNGINLFGFSTTGHMIPVMQAVGNKIDLIAYQGYNLGASLNRSIMYDAYAYYAEQYGFKIAAGVHYPEEPWGPYYTYSKQTTADLSSHVYNHTDRAGENDGIMIWQLLLEDANSSGYGYMHIASQILNGVGVPNAIAQADNYAETPYTGGGAKCGTSTGNRFCGVSGYNENNSYPNPGTQVYANCAIWENQWWANPGEKPGENSVWIEVAECKEEPACGGVSVTQIEATGCDNYTSPSGKHTWTSSGVYYDTLQGSTSDSIIKITLTINPTVYHEISLENCTPILSPSGKDTLKTTGIYTDTLTSSVGCDSILTIDFTLSQPTTDSLTIQKCEFYILLSGDTAKLTGIYYDTLLLSNGCKQPIYIDFTRFNIYSDTVIAEACNQYQLASGNVIDESGEYIDTLASVNDCDSIVVQEINIQQLEVEVYMQNDTLWSTVSDADLVWYNCNEQAIIPSESNSYFVPNESGRYAVIATQENCTDTSDCTTISISSLAEIGKNGFSITRVKNTINISSPNYLQTIELFDSQGKQLVFLEINHQKQVELKLPDQSLLLLLVRDKKGNTHFQRLSNFR